jgi:GTP-binding protein Era
MAFKSGFVTIVGKTNVGKSSIINRIVGEQVSVVVDKAQTTRKVVRGIYTTDDFQIIFLDTPGLHKSKSKLGDTMNESAVGTISDADIIVHVVEATDKNTDEKLIEKINKSKKPCILVINKIDLIDKEHLAEMINAYSDYANYQAIIPVSIKKDKGAEDIIEEIEKLLKPGPKYYDAESYTDQNLREIASEIIRQKTLKLLNDEVPHGVYVEVTKLKTSKTRNKEKIFDIDGTIYCLRESHKGIIIGKSGQMLKRIGTYAREDLEKMLDTKVNLHLWVKVRKDWINDSSIVKNFKVPK